MGQREFDVAVRVAYQNGELRRTPKAGKLDCGDIPDAALLPPGYAAAARTVAERRIMLAGYRFAHVLK